MQEKSLSEGFEFESQRLDSNQGTSRLLHSIAAHLHRYSSELDSLDTILSATLKHRQILQKTHEQLESATFIGICQDFAQLASHLKQAKSFVTELEQKSQNILALVSLQEKDTEMALSDHSQVVSSDTIGERSVHGLEWPEDARHLTSNSGGC